MKTNTPGQTADQTDTPIDETRPAAPPIDAAEAALKWPSEGGCYVRQADGTLTKEG